MKNDKTMKHTRTIRTLAMAAAAAMMLPIQTIMADTRTNGGNAYLLDQSVDVSRDFSDFTNTYFFVDSLTSFDTKTGRGTVVWKRQQLMPRQAFNANTYLHQPLKSLDFPNTAYPQDPELGFSIEPVNARTLRFRMHTSSVTPEWPDSLSPMLAGPVAVNAKDWKVTKVGKDIVYSSAYGKLVIKADPWRLIMYDKEGNELTRSRVWSDNDSTQIKVPPFSFIKRGSDNSRSINPVFSIQPMERIFGFGEAPGPLNKVGQKLNLFVSDPQGPESPDMYKPIPFFFSNLGYGAFIHTAAPLTVDVGQSYIGANKLFMKDEDLDMFLFWGTPKEILSEYTALSGRPEMPPLWSFGTWMSRISYFTEDEGREVAKQLRANKIPADVIHFDTGWFDVDWQCDYEFSPARFKDPAKMIKDLDKDGFKICLWQLPYFVPGNKYFKTLVDEGMAVRNGRGTLPYEDAVLDFTNPKTVKWYQDQLGKLLEMGVGAIKVDFGEAAPLDGIYANGRSGLYEHNLYPVRYNKAVADITKKVKGDNIIWARSAWSGSQRYPLHWGGDAASTNTGMLGTLHAGLSLGMSGFSFWSHDMGGFVTSTPEELYRRWLPMGFLTSHTRAHGAPPTEPWFYNREFTDYFRNGWPMFRALQVEFPEDPGVWQIEDEYMFGKDFLVAPLLTQTRKRSIYLPAGQEWVNYQSGETYTPGWHTLTPEGELDCIIMVRKGAEIPTVKPALSTSRIDKSTLKTVKY